VVISVLVWWSALEPGRRRLSGELWKLGRIFAARMGGMMLGMAFIAMRSPAYSGFYGERAREHGLGPLADQQMAGRHDALAGPHDRALRAGLLLLAGI
jgi:cytochrome c oxidase assembly factor CtaG